MPSATPLDLETILHFTRASRSSHVAAYSLTVFEWILCFPQEVQLVHKSRWTPAKVAYLFVRYYPLFTYPIVMWVQMVDHPTDECAKIFRLPMYLAIPNNFMSEIILVLRTYAVTGGNVKILSGLIGVLAAMIVYLGWMIGNKVGQMPFGTACFPVPRGHKIFITSPFLLMVAYDTLVTGVFVWYALKAVKKRMNIADKLLKTLLREGFVYFIIISLINIVNAGLNLQGNAAMAVGAVPLSLLMCNVIACRLVLNLREVGAKQRRMTIMSAHRPSISGSGSGSGSGSKQIGVTSSFTGGTSSQFTPASPPPSAASFFPRHQPSSGPIEIEMTPTPPHTPGSGSSNAFSSQQSTTESQGQRYTQSPTPEMGYYTPGTSPAPTQYAFARSLTVPALGRSPSARSVTFSEPITPQYGAVSFAGRTRPLPALPEGEAGRPSVDGIIAPSSWHGHGRPSTDRGHSRPSLDSVSQQPYKPGMI